MNFPHNLFLYEELSCIKAAIICEETNMAYGMSEPGLGLSNL